MIEVNELQKRRVMSKLQKHLGTLVGKEIGLLGLAFKPNTDDMREASSLVLSARLQAAGAKVRVYDPVAEEEARKLLPGVDFWPSAEAVAEGADAIVLVTEWPEFRGARPARAGRHACAGRCSSTAATSSTPRPRPPRASPTRASAGPSVAGRPSVAEATV